MSDLPIPADVVQTNGPAPEQDDYKSKFEELQRSFKSVQRELDKARRRGEDQSGINTRLDELAEDMALLNQVVTQVETVDDATRSRVTESEQRRVAGQAFRKAVKNQAVLIQETLDGLDMSWDSDPALGKARELWEKGVTTNDFETVVAAVHETVRAAKKGKAVTRTAPDESAPALKVDTKESTAPNRQPVTTDAVRKMSQSELYSRWDEVKKAAWGV